MEGNFSMMMQSYAPASTRKPAGYFRHNSLLSQLMSLLLAWTMVMSSLPAYATDQLRAQWVHSWGVGALPKPATQLAQHRPAPAMATRTALVKTVASPHLATSATVAALHAPALPGSQGSDLLMNAFGGSLFALPLQAPDSQLQVSVGFADNSSPSGNFPEPWSETNPLVNFVGSGIVYRAGAIRLDNPGSLPITVDSVKLDLGRPGPVFQLWQNTVVPVGGSAILTQTQDGNFNTSASPIVGCGLPLAADETRIPKITITVAGTSTDYTDTAHVLDTGGFDSSCRGNQSLQWRFGQTIQTIDGLNHVTTYAYDDTGHRTSVTDALNNVTSFVYDAAGNQTSVTDALNHTTQFVYDSANRRIKAIYPDQTFDSVSYDSIGRQSAKTDQAGKVTQFGYDGLGRISTVTQFLNGSPLVTAYGYDELGNHTTQTDANGHVTRFAYDQLGRRTSRTLPGGMTETYGYDAAGNVTSRADFNGHTATYQYDAMNRLKMKTADPFFSTGPCASGLCGAAEIAYNYDDAGRRSSMADASGTTSYTYDARDRLLTKTSPFAGTLVYTYDAAGNILSLSSSNANGASMTYTYDALNRLASVADASGVTSYTYDAAGNLGGFTYPNGVHTGYTYNALNRLTQMQSTCASGTGCGGLDTPLARYAYTLGPVGNRLSVAELGGRTVNYSYDDLFRLTSETIAGASQQNGAITYQYDSVGNRRQRNSSVPAIPATGLLNYDANDRTATDPYDANGNLLNAGSGSSVYDFENRLVQSGGVKLVYDGDGNRVSETVAGISTNYLVADQNLTGYAQVLDEMQGTAVTRSYSYGLELINERQMIADTLTTSFYGYDGHGSVRFLTSSSGAITDAYDYDAYGNLISQTGATPNNYRFAGEQFDPLLGIYYNRARYYDQRQGRFWSMDTWGGRRSRSLVAPQVSLCTGQSSRQRGSKW
jgi:RHS repeat-associated protein